jgi:hypothetical protein
MNIEELKGLTLAEIKGMHKGSEEVIFTTTEGRRFRMFHPQSCCEVVEVEDVTGEPDNLIGTPLHRVYESTNSDKDQPSEYCESWTWTFYHLGTIKGYVALRWLGTSNGYYSESVCLEEVDKAEAGA